MKVSSSNKAIIAKAKSMYGKRLTLENYRELMRKQSIDEIAYQLKLFEGYKSAFESLSDASLQSGNLEHILRRTLFERYGALRRYNFIPDNQFYNYLTISAEVKALIVTLRHLVSSDTTDILMLLPGYITGSLSFDILSLSHVTNYEELLMVIRKSDYYDIFKRLTPPVDRKLDYLSYENALRQYQYSKLFAAIDEFPKETSVVLKELYSSLVELINIANLYRLKVTYNESPERIRSYLFGYGAKLSTAQLNQLINCNSEDFISLLRKTYYGRYLPDNPEEHFEHTTHMIRYHMCKKLLRFSSDPTVVFATYLALHEIEIENITTIIECVGYRIPPQEIEKLLIL